MASLPRNIVLCSDGTGNSGINGRGTNVFKLFETIDRQWRGDDPHKPTHEGQIAFYDDGVGTEELKWLKLLTGAFGIGLKRNVKRLYVQLARVYQPGDQIYLFGFSRGAFTVRMLAGLIAECGILQSAELSYAQLWQGAQAAMEVHRAGYYRKMLGTHNPAKITHSATSEVRGQSFREKYKVWHPADDPRVRIRFIGVWDTVEAYGFPVESVAEFWDRFIYPFRFPDTYLSEYVEHACHALSIDDERATFKPVLWQGRHPKTKEEEKRIEQVWFAGVHANVGGGYPKQGMSLVALQWMMDKAHEHGLRFIPHDRELVAKHQDIQDKLYDSRSGLGAYYRYAPRDIHELCTQAQIATPKLHASVIQRIQTRTEEYAPAKIPPAYAVDPPGAVSAEVNASQRGEKLEIVGDVIGWRKALYRLMMITTLCFVFFCWWNRTPLRTPDLGNWSAPSRLAYALVDPLLSLVEWATPAYFKDGVIALRHHPLATLAFGGAMVAIFLLSGKLARMTREMSFRAWRSSLPNLQGKVFPPDIESNAWTKLARLAGRFRETPPCRLWMTRIMPALAIFGVLGILLSVLASWIVSAASIASNPASEAPHPLTSAEPVTFPFDTTNSLQAAPVILVRGEKYRITVIEQNKWADNGIDAGPEGIEKPSRTQEYLGWFRRDPKHRWFMMLGALDPAGESSFPIGRATEYRAPRTGQLYLYVNDVFGFYDNNHGTAEIRIECLSATK